MTRADLIIWAILGTTLMGWLMWLTWMYPNTCH